ncbi:MAG: gliding motility-associated protein GldE [Prevotellaceae bacterium]|nr:gliding motility-associated protein GldE [Prevotellaceae bacterium]
MEPPSYLLSIAFYPLNSEHLIGFALLPVLIFISALVSGSETAFFSLSPQDIDNIKKNKNKTSDYLNRLLEKQDYLLATVLIFNNFVNIAIILISTYLTHSLIDFGENVILGFIIEGVLITFILVLFCEVIPKLFTASRPVSSFGFVAKPLVIMIKIAKPLSYALMGTTSLLNRKLSRKKSNVSIDDLSEAIDFTDKSIGDKKILKSIVELANIDANDIMHPRIDVYAIDIESDFKKLLTFVVDCGYSRIPVYEENFDSIKGLLFVKDLLPYLSMDENFGWQSLIREAYFVPENKKMNDLLKEFQQKSIHMAVVVDEYGGTSGIITLEDILEEIVGEISDENDESQKLFTKLNRNTYLFEGKTSLNDFCKIMNLDNDYFDEINGDAETLAGLILEICGEIPSGGREIEFRQFGLKIENSDVKRIKEIKVTVKSQNDDDSNNEN